MAEIAASDVELASLARLGIFGGTFDPIHLAHLIIAQEAATQLQLDRILFIPAGQPPHKQGKPICPAPDRLAMVAAAIADNPRFALSTIETEQAGPSFTVETLRRLRHRLGARPQFFLLLGGDMVYDMVNWRDPAGIVQQLAGIAAVQRPGFMWQAADLAALDARVPGLGAAIRPVSAPQCAISATAIRERVARHLPIRYLVPDAVATHIAQQGLYLTNATSEEGQR